MRHRHSRLRLNMKPARAAGVERNLVTSLLLYESLRTTRKRAKILQPIIDRLLARAKRQSPREAIRALSKVVTHPNASRKVLEVLIGRYKHRSSGFTSIKAAGSRKGDGAEVVDISLVP